MKMKMHICSCDIRMRFNHDMPVVVYDGPVDYEKVVINRPSINGVELIGDKSSEDLDIHAEPPKVIGENLIFS